MSFQLYPVEISTSIVDRKHTGKSILFLSSLPWKRCIGVNIYTRRNITSSDNSWSYSFLDFSSYCSAYYDYYQLHILWKLRLHEHYVISFPLKPRLMECMVFASNYCLCTCKFWEALHPTSIECEIIDRFISDILTRGGLMVVWMLSTL